MAAVAVTAHVTGLCATIWWRRAAARLGRPGTLLLVLAVPVAFVGFYAWAWGQVSPIMATMSTNEALAELLLPGLLVSLVMVCAVLRAAMLAFDFIAPDLRVTLATAPLSRGTRMLVQVAPDFGFSALLSVGLGSVGLASYAASSGRIGLGPVLALGLACCALVGAVTVGLELLLIHVTRDALAARSGAAAGVLLSVCLVMLWLSQAVQSGSGVGQLQQLGRALLGHDAVVTLVSLMATATLLVGWGFADSLIAPEARRGRQKAPWLRVPRGSRAVVSALTFLRDPANRVGALGMLSISIFGAALERMTGLPIAMPLAGAVALLVLNGAALYTYGEFLELRWRLVASPVSLRGVLPAWIAGHLAAGLLIAVVLATPVAVLATPAAVPDLDLGLRTSAIALVSIGLSLVSGRVLPYQRDDIFALAGSGTAALVLTGVAWLALRDLPAPITLVAGLLIAGGAVSALAMLEPSADE